MKGHSEPRTGAGVRARIESATDPAESGDSVVVLRVHRGQQVKAAILADYFRAAQRGRISFIRYYRVRAGLDQVELGRLAKMTQPEIARAERPGQARNMKGFTLKKLATALGGRVDELLQ
jgi:hypothetical protein